jgi:hypothetical protein
MGKEFENNRIDDLSSPELIAQINADISAAVREVVEQFDAALREHPEQLLEAREKYFGN